MEFGGKKPIENICEGGGWQNPKGDWMKRPSIAFKQTNPIFFLATV